MNKSWRTRSGFTLLELMVVVTLIAVLAMTVTPVFRDSFAGIRADHAVRDLYSDMKSAQSRAVTEAAEYRVYFEPSKNRYWMVRAVSENGEIIFEPVYSLEGEVVTLPDSLSLSDVKGRRGDRNTYYLAFYPSGLADHGEVQLSERDDSRAVYTIQSTGGRVDLYVPGERPR